MKIFRERLDSDLVPSVLAEAMETAGLGQSISWAGNLDLLVDGSPRVGMIGTREPSGLSEGLLFSAASSIAGEDAIVVSGGAQGIDMACHRGAVSAGGFTIVCLPGGLDRLLSDGWRAEFPTWLNGGRCLLLSPFPSNQEVTRQTPVLRNKLIAALSEAMVVGQAGAQSGTHTCTRFAIDFGVPLVFQEYATTDSMVRQTFSFLKSRQAWSFCDQLPVDFAQRVVAMAEDTRKKRERIASAQLRLFD